MTVTIAAIKAAAARHYGLPVREIDADRRTVHLVRARHVAMTLARRLTAHSLPAIGEQFGRDHTTVLDAVRKIEAKAAVDDAMAVALAAIEAEATAMAEPPSAPMRHLAERLAPLVAGELARLIEEVRPAPPAAAPAPVAAPGPGPAEAALGVLVARIAGSSEALERARYTSGEASAVARLVAAARELAAAWRRTKPRELTDA